MFSEPEGLSPNSIAQRASFEQVRCIEVYIAACDGDVDILKRIESALIRSLMNSEGPPKSFLDNDRISKSTPEAERVTISMTGLDNFQGLGDQLEV